MEQRHCKLCKTNKPITMFDSAGEGRRRHECKKCRADIEHERRLKKRSQKQTDYTRLKKRLKEIRAMRRDGQKVVLTTNEMKICKNPKCIHNGKKQPIDCFTTSIISEDLLRNHCNTCITKQRLQKGR